MQLLKTIAKNRYTASETIEKVLLIAGAFIIGGILVGILITAFTGSDFQNGIQNWLDNILNW